MVDNLANQISAHQPFLLMGKALLILEASDPRFALPKKQLLPLPRLELTHPQISYRG